jgi:hypothetical protein
MSKKHELKKVRLALFFKDFAAWIHASCVGLNVAGFTTAKYLQKEGINVSVYPVRHNVDVVDSINKYKETNNESLTHVIISAPWISLYDMRNLVAHFPHIKFLVLSHSNVGFLQADPWGVELYRQYAELSKTYKNLHIGGNCSQFTHWFESAYGEQCVLLPNIYPCEKVRSKKWDGKSPLKIGAFGAIRPEKNFMTAAAAATAIQRKLGVDVELHMSTGGDGCKSPTLPAIGQMTKDIKGLKLIRHDWQLWDGFIELIADMDLMIQISYTESFNMVTADGVSCGVPSVVSSAIRWAPLSWRADVDDSMSVADKGIELLEIDQRYLGYEALVKSNAAAFEHWEHYLSNSF